MIRQSTHKKKVPNLPFLAFLPFLPSAAPTDSVYNARLSKYEYKYACVRVCACGGGGGGDSKTTVPDRYSMIPAFHGYKVYK